MPVFAKQLHLPYSPRQMFDLVADIESYPRFLPHFVFARILQREGNRLLVEQQVKFKLLRFTFRTEANFEPPHRIDIVCRDSPFGSFTDQWSFEEDPSGGTLLRCRTEVNLRPGMLRTLLPVFLEESSRKTVQAFEKRAAELYTRSST
jgi:coenzyme Q-binding protein COQ10